MNTTTSATWQAVTLQPPITVLAAANDPLLVIERAEQLAVEYILQFVGTTATTYIF